MHTNLFICVKIVIIVHSVRKICEVMTRENKKKRVTSLLSDGTILLTCYLRSIVIKCEVNQVF